MTITFGGKDRQPARVRRDGHRRRRCQGTRRRTRSTQRGHRMRIPAPLRIRSDSAAVLSGRSRGVPGPVWEALADPAGAGTFARTAREADPQSGGFRRCVRLVVIMGVGQADALLTLLRRSSLQQPATVAAAFAAIVSSQIVVISALKHSDRATAGGGSRKLDQHPAAEIYLSQPGLGQVLAARVLGEFGDDPRRFGGALARKS